MVMMNKLEIKEENNIILSPDEEKEVYFFTKEKIKKTFYLQQNSHLKIYHYHIDQDIDIEIYLNGENAQIEYYFSTINYQDHHDSIKIYHHAKNTVSHLSNHGVNVENGQLVFDVCCQVGKDIKGCVCNQENQIMNLKDGKGLILPILYINHYDVSSSHSAYIGKFKDEVLFYLMSRGIEYKLAQMLLIKGFLIHQGDCSKDEVLKLQKEIESI